MSFIGQLGKFLSFSVTVNGGSGYTTLYTNNTLLTNNKPYIVTAEIAFRRVGSGWDDVIITFHNNVDNYTGLPFICNVADNAPYLGTRPALLGYPHSIRQSAQAYITNGVIRLVCDSTYNETISYEIYLSAIEVNTFP